MRKSLDLTDAKACWDWVGAGSPLQLTQHPDFFEPIPVEHRADFILYLKKDVKAEKKLLEAGVIDEYGQDIWHDAANMGDDPMKRLPARIHGISEGVNAYDMHRLNDPHNPIVADLGMPSVEQGKAVWGDRYLVLPNGDHGPANFRTRAEKLEYMKKTGHRETKSYTS